MSQFVSPLLPATLVAVSLAAQAQSLPAGAVATVNGEPIRQSVYEQNLRANLAQGLKDTPQLRQTVKEELINRELMAQQAEKLGLDKTPEGKILSGARRFREDDAAA